MPPRNLTREAALSFLLTHVVVEKAHSFEMNPATLFTLMNMAAEAETRISQQEGLIPHEVIEALAAQFLERHAS